LVTAHCLLITDASPTASGAPDWRRYLALAEHYRTAGYQTFGLLANEGETDANSIRWLRQATDQCAVCSGLEAATAVSALSHRYGFEVAHAASARLGWALGGPNRDLVRIVDMQERPQALYRRLGWSLSEEEERSFFNHADLVVTADRADAKFVTELGHGAVEAPFLRRGLRLQHPPITGGRFLAGLWVEASPSAIETVEAFFDTIRERGGGAAPNFAIAGPGALKIALPTLPYPVTVTPPDMEERIFYRSLDLCIAPDLFGGAPRLDVMSALEMGATPLASSSALTGVRQRWRLPHFGNLHSLSEYLFEKGDQMRDGGLLPELRARADWTWASLSNVAARHRERLNSRIRAVLKSKVRAKDS
jgi:hypothetical protein